MGEGLVLEHGSHDDLLSRDGAYARLVQAQKLRESGDTYTDDGSNAGAEQEDMEKAAREEVPLGRKNTGHSLASEILEQKRQAAGADKKDKAHGLVYLFKRMGKLNREGWSSYLWGSIFASSGFSTVLDKWHSLLTCSFSDRYGLPGIWCRLCERHRRVLL
jgi:ATP-binding cassette subfamily B (MDR/TAP) protein 1